MKILVLNCGSSSVKFQVIKISSGGNEEKEDMVYGKGLIERIGRDDAIVNYISSGNEKIQLVEPIKDHKAAIEKVIALLLDEKVGVLSSMDEIEAVGHRMVHGGEEFTSSVLIDENVLNRMKECTDLAPLHNPANLKGYEASREVMPHVHHVGVFDTAFHQTMPPSSYLYAIPLEYYRRYKIRRFGFHGTSHRYVLHRYCKLTGKDPAQTSMISCHLGNGASIVAIKNGKSLDTSMGFTPLEGLVMGTRSGDLDPAIHQFVINKEGSDIDEFTRILNKESGMLGLTEKSNDFREIVAAFRDGDELCRTALEVYCYRLKKYIGAYMAALNGTDVIIFTGGVGENSDLVRETSAGSLDSLGIDFDPEMNLNMNGREGKISRDSSKVEVYVIPTNEELVIAWDTYRCVEDIDRS